MATEQPKELPKLREVFILGPDDTKALSPMLDKARQSGIYEEKQEGIIIGDAIRAVSLEEIVATLKGRIDKDTHILLGGHGNVKHGNHFIWMGELLSTKEVVKALDDLTKDPIQISISSCYAGAVHKDMGSFKSGTVINTYTAANEPEITINAQHLIKYRAEMRSKQKTMHAAQQFLDSMSKFPATSTYGESRGKDKKPFHFTFVPLKDRPIRETATIERFITYKEEGFKQRYYAEVDTSMPFVDPPQLTKQESQRVLNDIFLVQLESTHQDVPFIEAYLEDTSDASLIDKYLALVSPYLTPKRLRELGININRQDEDGDSALADAETMAQVQALIKLGIDLEIRNNEGKTPFMEAENAEVAKAMLEAGANPYLKDKEGESAEILEEPEVQEFLKEWEQKNPKKAAAAQVVAERAEGERRAKSAEDIAGSTPTEGETSKDFGNRVASQKAVGQTTSDIFPPVARVLPERPTLPRSWWDTIRDAGSAMGGVASRIAGYDPANPPPASGAMAAETPPPTSEQWRQMGVTTEAELAARQQKIAPAAQPSSSSQIPKGEPALSDPGPSRWWHPNPKAAYDEEKGASAIAISDAISNSLTLAVPLVKAGLKYFGVGLSPAEQAERSAGQSLPGQEVEEIPLDRQDKKDMLREVNATRNAIEQTYGLFIDRHAALVDRLNGLSKPHNEAERKTKEELRADLDLATKMRDDAFALTAGLGKLHGAMARRKTFTQKDKDFVEEKMAPLREAIEPIERALLFGEEKQPDRQTHVKRHRGKRRSGRQE